jgi:hypothetical protein
LSDRVKNDNDGIPREQENSNIANTKKLMSIGIYDIGFNKNSQNHCISFGLNYLDFEEPCEQSQANVLNMVEKFVWLNTIGLSEELVDTERGVNQYQVQFKNLFQLILKPFNYIQ